MKKKKQRITAVLLMVLMLVVSVCSNVTTADASALSAEKYLARMQKVYSKTKSVEMSQITTVVMKMNGQKMTSRVLGSGIFHFNTSKAKCVQKVTASAEGEKQTQTVRMYVKKSKGKLYMYTSSDGKTYQKTELGDMDDFTSSLGQVNTDSYSNAKIVDKSEKIGNTDTVKISCQITGKDMQRALKQAGLSSSELKKSGLNFSKMKAINLTYWIDKKTYRPVKCSMDMTAFMNDLIKVFIKAMQEIDQSGTSVDFRKLKCTSVKSTINYKNYNKAKKISYPRGVK